MRITLSDAEATTRLGQVIAPLLAPGDSVLLYGPLGMGKSTLARGLIRALTTPDEDVPSPTFTLVQFYDSEPPVAHFDLYRLTRPEEAFEIGLDEALDEGCAVIEWPERLGRGARAFPRPRPPDPYHRGGRRRPPCDRFRRRPVGSPDRPCPCLTAKTSVSTS